MIDREPHKRTGPRHPLALLSSEWPCAQGRARDDSERPHVSGDSSARRPDATFAADRAGEPWRGWWGLRPAPTTAKKCKHGKKKCRGRCIPKAACCTAANCPAGQPCVDGACRALPCATNAGCGAGQICWAFQCVEAGGPCPSDGPCPNSQFCRDGSCQGGGLCFLDVNCTSPQVCAGGVCQGGGS